MRLDIWQRKMFSINGKSERQGDAKGQRVTFVMGTEQPSQQSNILMNIFVRCSSHTENTEYPNSKTTPAQGYSHEYLG